jgi:hypothetical protein
MQFPCAPHRVAELAGTLLIVLALVGNSLCQTAKTAGNAPKVAEGDASISGSITNGVYRNTTFGFSYKIAYGWVDRTQEMAGDSTKDSTEAKKSLLLLAVFERPPVASGDSINSAVVVAAEAASSYPDLKNEAQYFDLVSELAKSKDLKVVNEPYDFPLGATQLVRGDFSKPLGSLTLHQSTLVMKQKGYFVSFTFIGGTEDEVDGLIESLSFNQKEAAAPRK